VIVRPLWGYIVKDGEVRWQPAIDVLRVVVGGQLLASPRSSPSVAAEAPLRALKNHFGLPRAKRCAIGTSEPPRASFQQSGEDRPREGGAHASLEAFERIAPQIPVFRVRTEQAPGRATS